MDELGYVVVIIIVAIASVIGKIQEQRKAQEGKKSRKPVRPEDLPEATRRLLYGAPEKPVSETRRQEPQVRTAQPRTARPVQRQQPQTVRRPVVPQPQRRPQQAVQPPPPPPRRRPAAVRQATAPETQSLQAQHAHVMAQRRKHLEDAQAQHAASLKKTQQMQQRMSGRPQQGRPAARAAASPVSGLFTNLDDVRRGIIMMEVLGSPKAFK